MGLVDYLKYLGECTDDELAGEFGVSDNFPIFLDIEFERLLAYFPDHGFTSDGVLEEAHQFNYDPGTILAQVMDWVVLYKCTEGRCNFTEEGRIHSDFQQEHFNSTIMLHPYQEKKIPGIHWYQATANVIQEIGAFIINERIPACLTNLGDNHLDDLSRTVYHLKRPNV